MLPFKEAIKRIRQAYENKELQAQQEKCAMAPGGPLNSFNRTGNEMRRKCLYRDPVSGAKCAIGVILTDEEISFIGNMLFSQTSLAERDEDGKTTKETRILTMLQEAHDTWNIKQTDKAETDFLFELAKAELYAAKL